MAKSRDTSNTKGFHNRVATLESRENLLKIKEKQEEKQVLEEI